VTRVNLVPVAELADQHLFAEWRELKMIPRSLARSLAGRSQAQVLARVPGAFTLNTGHVMFFYDKARFLRRRYDALTAELLDRGYRLDDDHALDATGVWSGLPLAFHQDYVPTAAAAKLSRARIEQRIAIQPHWYRWRGLPRGATPHGPTVEDKT
jgi:deoxyribonuclease (pyrimidine dimer)